MRDKIKVLHVVGTMNMGGAETILMNLYRNINRKKIEFPFLQYVDNSSYYDDEIIKLGGKIIRLKTVREREILKAILGGEIWGKFQRKFIIAGLEKKKSLIWLKNV